MIWTPNSLLELNGASVALLPDPHLGRKFINDVPLHRRGDRERMVWEDFEQRLRTLPTYTRYHVTLGDLFDTPNVSAETVLRAANAYLAAAKRLEKCSFVILAGNHDIGRSLQPVSFDLFSAIVEGQFNIKVVRDKGEAVGPFAVVPWSPTKTAAEIISGLPRKAYTAIFGHWDLSGDVPNLLPTQELCAITSLAITGHDHKRRSEKRGSLDVLCAGSMQPYAHGEDDGTMYRTYTLDDLPEDTRNLCLRVMLRKEEVPPEHVDALQVQFRRVEEVVEEMLPLVVDQNFSVGTLITQACQRRGINPDVVQRLTDAFAQLR